MCMCEAYYIFILSKVRYKSTSQKVSKVWNLKSKTNTKIGKRKPTSNIITNWTAKICIENSQNEWHFVA